MKLEIRKKNIYNNNEKLFIVCMYSNSWLPEELIVKIKKKRKKIDIKMYVSLLSYKDINHMIDLQYYLRELPCVL